MVVLIALYALLWLVDGRLVQVRRYERQVWVGSAGVGSSIIAGRLLPQAATETRIPLVPVLVHVKEVGPFRAVVTESDDGGGLRRRALTSALAITPLGPVNLRVEEFDGKGMIAFQPIDLLSPPISLVIVLEGQRVISIPLTCDDEVRYMTWFP